MRSFASEGRFITVPRTRGVSTTDIIGRMLLFAKPDHQQFTSSTSLSLGSNGSKNKMAVASKS